MENKFSGKKIIFMGTPYVSANYLNILIKNNYNIISSFTQPPRKKNRGMQLECSPVEILAKKNKITVNSPRKLDINSFEKIKLLKPDLIIVMAYGLLIPKEILNLPNYGCINVHVSLLPRWRGAAPIEHTLVNGDKKTGISIIKLTEKLDAGPIILQEEVQVEETTNKENLTNHLLKIGTKNLIYILPKLFSNNINFKKQNEKEATYANKINSEMRKINFNLSSEKIYNKIRAFSPNPGTWFFYNNERIKILSAKKSNKKGIPGTILNNNFEISCNDGSILPIYMQKEGKKSLFIDDFLRGFNFKVGDKLNE